jgi:hypothetical protein
MGAGLPVQPRTCGSAPCLPVPRTGFLPTGGGRVGPGSCARRGSWAFDVIGTPARGDNADAGFTEADVKDAKKAEAVYKVIRERLEKYRTERPGGYLVREAPAEDLKQLKVQAGHLKEGSSSPRSGRPSPRAR